METWLSKDCSAIPAVLGCPNNKAFDNACMLWLSEHSCDMHKRSVELFWRIEDETNPRVKNDLRREYKELQETMRLQMHIFYVFRARRDRHTELSEHKYYWYYRTAQGVNAPPALCSHLSSKSLKFVTTRTRTRARAPRRVTRSHTATSSKSTDTGDPDQPDPPGSSHPVIPFPIPQSNNPTRMRFTPACWRMERGQAA